MHILEVSCCSVHICANEIWHPVNWKRNFCLDLRLNIKEPLDTNFNNVLPEVKMTSAPCLLVVSRLGCQCKSLAGLVSNYLERCKNSCGWVMGPSL